MTNRILVGNTDCINEEFIDEFVNIQEGLPILLLNILDDISNDVETKRYLLYDKFPHLEKLDSREIEIVSKFLKEGKPKEAEEFQIGYALDFLEKYPRFKCMVSVESQASGDIRIMANTIKEAFLGDFDYF